MSYRSKLFANIFTVFMVFTVIVVVFQHRREVTYRRDVVENRLCGYADIYAKLLNDTVAVDSQRMKDVSRLMPADLRLTVIDREGNVVYESAAQPQSMDNHQNRPEVRQAMKQGEGWDIRYSSTESKEYFYLAKRYGAYTIRVSLPYDVSLQNLLKTDNIFLWFILLLLPLVIFMLVYISGHFGKSIAMLKFFVSSAERGLIDYDHISFPRSELGEIGETIMQKYKELDESNRNIVREREKLIRHFLYFKEGIAIFTPTRDLVYANPHFLQYINLLFDHPSADVSKIWQLDALKPVIEFLQLHREAGKSYDEAPVYSYPLAVGRQILNVQALVYNDGGFEITLSDITETEKTIQLKQKMSNNITHELRTPLSSIRGYLETLLAHQDMDPARRQHFLKQANDQTLRLTNLIRDVALITRVDEAPRTFEREPVNLHKIVSDICEEFHGAIEQHHATIDNELQPDLQVKGNYSLLYSIFRNLIENSLAYAGDDIRIHVECYRQEQQLCFIDYYDTGKGVPEEHLPHLFERFYRVSQGRTRDDGGTGLGLSIVRNAVRFHGGDISVRNRKGGGLEFLFTLSI